jgi:hypothetical protein
MRQRNGEYFFDPRRVEELITDYQVNENRETLGAIVKECERNILSLIRDRGTFAHEDEDELLSIVNRKLLVSLPQFDRARGSAFSFVSRLTVNMLATTVTHRRKLASRYPPLDKTLLLTWPDERAAHESRVAIDDLAHQIRGIKSVQEGQAEREAQKWYVESFIDAGFELRRHECADAAMKVYGLTHRRSRQLYDLTLLEIRRALWEETKHASVSRERLCGTKGLPLARYWNFLSPVEFTKFCCLMRDLAPYLVILVRPANAAGIKAGDWNAVRENLELILNGTPEATPLFAE